MRGIKFRAWDRITETMCLVSSLSYEVITNELISVILSECNREIVWRNIEDIILLQYTGLKDKNGVEIYEGDIIREELAEGEYLLISVIYKNGGFMGKERNYKPEYSISHFLGGEVIGNIYEYENPELLEGYDDSKTSKLL